MQCSKITLSVVALMLLTLWGCVRREKPISSSSTHTHYAQLFALEAEGDGVIFLDGPERETWVPQGDGISSDKASPRYVCLSSTHIAFLSSLGEAAHIVGTPDSSYIFNEDVKKRIREGLAQVVTFGGGVNSELIFELRPTVIFADRMRANEMEMFEDKGINVVYVEEYREASPLARTEWLRVFGRIAGKAAFADSLFTHIEKAYEEVAEKVKAQVTTHFTIFGGMAYQGVWYVSGGGSYIARLYEDAGAEYLFADNTRSASIPLDFEAVYEKGSAADFWRIVYGSSDSVTYEQLATLNRHYKDFPAFKSKRVLLCNPTQSAYFEQGVVEPQVILSDLVFALYPQLLTGYKPKYYYLLP
ncbi:MAG: hypothetical protein CSA95_06025 [Bacteroidetes bacterium]|nr:MAG: hypothetical protein CSA95_06025 [Bacteroidota bacterium]PIE87681.1 MAG: hypothetical protein CSA04_05740 [Bacteroidota bacterium]